MKNRIIVWSLSFLFMGPGFLVSQEEGWQKLELPQKTMYYKLNH